MTITTKEQCLSLLSRIELYDSEYTPQQLIDCIKDGIYHWTFVAKVILGCSIA